MGSPLSSVQPGQSRKISDSLAGEFYGSDARCAVAAWVRKPVPPAGKVRAPRRAAPPAPPDQPVRPPRAGGRQPPGLVAENPHRRPGQLTGSDELVDGTGGSSVSAEDLQPAGPGPGDRCEKIHVRDERQVEQAARAGAHR